MRLVVRQYFSLKNGNSLGTFQKECDSKLAPVAGMYYNDSTWNNPKEIMGVSLKERSYLIEVEHEKLEDENVFQDLKNKYIQAGWCYNCQA